jgi:NAD(P)H-dependent FMN reductase
VIEIIAGTDRPGSRTLQVANLLQSYFREFKIETDVLDLSKLPIEHLHGSAYKIPEPMNEAIGRITSADGLVIVIPEYNGSFPGALKHFIDYWKFPDSFEGRPVAFVGLGGRFGGLRPVEQMSQVFSYRNSYLFPLRVFLINVHNTVKDGQLSDPVSVDLLKTMARDFQKFIRALKSEGLDANSLRKV